MLPNSQYHASLITFTEEILNEKGHVLCSVNLFTIVLYNWIISRQNPSL